MTDDATLDLIDSNLRGWYEFLLPDDKAYILESWRVCFGVRSIDNVRRWLTRGAIQRRFVNRQLSSEEFEMRLSFAKSVTGMRFITAPQKVKEIILPATQAGQKLRSYLRNDFIQAYLKRAEFFDDRIVLSYDQDSSTEGDVVTDSDVLEHQ